MGAVLDHAGVVASADLIRSLGEQIETRRPRLDLLDAYFEARQPGALRHIAPEIRAVVGNRLAPVIVNWPRLTIGAVEERLDVVGFRLGSDQPTDRALWDVWQANNMDVDSQAGHLDALLYGASYAIVWAGTTPGKPRISVESARQVTVLYAPGTRDRVAALKLWVEDGYARAVVFEAEAVTRWRSVAKMVETGETVAATTWRQVERITNPLGVVPVVELRNRGRVLGAGESELTDVLPLTDAIAKLASDLMVSAEFHAMPRRWATGVEIAEGADGEPAEAFNRTPGRTWLLEDPEARVGQFGEATLSGFVAGVELLTQQLAAVTAIPAHYLNSLTGQLPSAESLRAAEASLVAKARRKQRSFGESWEEVARLALLVRDGRLPDGADRLETVWADPETRTVAQLADAVGKMRDLGLPWQACMEQLGFSPTEIERFRVLRRQEAIDGQGIDLDQLMRGDDAA